MRDAMLLALEKAAQRLGSYEAVWSELGLTRQNRTYWRKTGRVSHKAAPKLSELSGVPLHELRPDIWQPSDYRKIAS